MVDRTSEAWRAFEAGARAVFDSWTALRLAVEGQWGGLDSAGKKEELFLDVMYYFENCESPRQHQRYQSSSQLKKFKK